MFFADIFYYGYGEKSKISSSVITTLKLDNMASHRFVNLH